MARRLLFLLLLLPAAGRAQEETPAGDREDAPAADVTPEARDKAILAALDVLDEGLWKLNDGGSPRRQFAMAVAGWAYLLAPDKGGKKLPSRRRQLDRIHDELVRYVERVEKLYEKDDERRRPPGPPGFEAMWTAQYVWPLGVTANFLAECVERRYRSAPSKKAVKVILRVLELSQQADGGWGHDDASRPGMGLPPIRIPKPGGGELEYPGTLLAASHCALAGLGAAHVALRSRRTDTREKGRAYFAAAQNADGTWPYDPSQKHGEGFAAPMAGSIETARAAGAVYALFWAGAARDDEVARRGLDAVDANVAALSEGHGSATMALLYGALLSRARGDRAWTPFRAEFFPRILAHQEKDGAFLCACRHESPGVTCDTRALEGMPAAAQYVDEQKVYVTALHVMVLMLDRTSPRAQPEIPAPAGPVTR